MLVVRLMLKSEKPVRRIDRRSPPLWIRAVFLNQDEQYTFVYYRPQALMNGSKRAGSCKMKPRDSPSSRSAALLLLFSARPISTNQIAAAGVLDYEQRLVRQLKNRRKEFIFCGKQFCPCRRLSRDRFINQLAGDSRPGNRLHADAIPGRANLVCDARFRESHCKARRHIDAEPFFVCVV
jgi:hypothetical protein